MAARSVSRLGWLLALVAVVALALAFRLPRLDQRPMHGDEANQAVRAGLLLEEGTYHYDPTDHHGPVLYFAALPFCRATSRTFAETTEWNYRLVPVFFGVLTLLLMAGLGLRRDGGLFDNRWGLLTAILLTAVSPPMVYYSRFFIQETMLVTFLTGMLVCGRKYVQAADGGAASGSRRAMWYAAGFGAFAGLSVATKETVVLSFAAGAVAAFAAFGWRRLWRACDVRHLAVAVGMAAFVAILFFSSFFTHPKGVYDAVFSTVAAYFSRATEVPEHQHPWDFHLKILFWFKYGRGPVWSEAGLLIPALLAAVAAWWPLRTRDEAAAGQRRFIRFVLVYTVALTALYCAIPYKTPWCVLSFLHGFILLAGVGVGRAVEGLKRFRAVWRVAGACAVLAFVGWLFWRHSAQACRACFKMPADPRNPYVYAHTGSDAMNLVAAIEEAARRADGHDTMIAIAVPTPDTWPLPWYLRKYRQVGYWQSVAEIPETLKPVVVIVAADEGDVAEARFGEGKRASFFGIRPGVLLNVFLPVR